MQHFRPEGRADELAIGRVRNGLEHLCHRRPVLRIQVGVDLVEEVEWRRIAGLNGKDQGESTQTW